MRTILHLIPAWIAPSEPGAECNRRRSDAELLAFRDLSLLDTDRRHELLFLGGSEEARAAGALGAPISYRVAPLLKRAGLASRAIENVLDDHDPDAVVSWDPSFGSRLMRLRGLPTRVARVDLSGASIDARGVNPETGEATRSRSSLRPAPIGPGPVRARQELRERLKIEVGERVVGVLSEGPDAAITLAFSAGMLNLGSLPCTGLVRRGIPGLERARRHVREGGYLRRMIVVGPPVMRFLPALDAALMPMSVPPAFDALCVLRSVLATGLPVVTAAGPETAPLFPGEASVCLARSSEPPHLAGALSALLANPGVLEGARAALEEAGRQRAEPLARQVAASLSDLGGLA
ncbi:hypothetical protein PHYC_00203 [Phycisphaerales bacterium]|nr:hypothetical protein PHYC_00203 [Phycisphaerales bacterium]